MSPASGATTVAKAVLPTGVIGGASAVPPAMLVPLQAARVLALADRNAVIFPDLERDGILVAIFAGAQAVRLVQAGRGAASEEGSNLLMAGVNRSSGGPMKALTTV